LRYGLTRKLKRATDSSVLLHF